MSVSSYAIAAALLAGTAVLAWMGPPPHQLLRRLGQRRPAHPATERVRALSPVARWRAGGRTRIGLAAGLVGGAVVAGSLVAGLAGGLRGLLAAELVVVAVHVLARRHDDRVARRRDAQWQEACEILAAELHAGRTAEEAVVLASRSCDDLVPVVNTLRMGGDVPAALRAVPDAPAADGLASAWATAQASGAGLAGVVERVLDELAERLALRREVGSQLAAPRATARLLALLPLGGMGLGVMLGVDPVSMLLGSTLGLCCLVSGSVLALAGVAWVDRLARRAQVS